MTYGEVGAQLYRRVRHTTSCSWEFYREGARFKSRQTHDEPQPAAHKIESSFMADKAEEAAKKDPAKRSVAEQQLVDKHSNRQSVRNLDHEAKKNAKIHGSHFW